MARRRRGPALVELVDLGRTRDRGQATVQPRRSWWRSLTGRASAGPSLTAAPAARLDAESDLPVPATTAQPQPSAAAPAHGPAETHPIVARLPDGRVILTVAPVTLMVAGLGLAVVIVGAFLIGRDYGFGQALNPPAKQAPPLSPLQRLADASPEATRSAQVVPAGPRLIPETTAVAKIPHGSNAPPGTYWRIETFRKNQTSDLEEVRNWLAKREIQTLVHPGKEGYLLLLNRPCDLRQQRAVRDEMDNLGKAYAKEGGQYRFKDAVPYTVKSKS